MKKTILLPLVLLCFLVACGTQSTQTATDEVNNSTETNAAIEKETNENIYFFGDYVIDGNPPTQDVVCNRIIFYPDGKCYAHYLYQDGKERGYYSYYYSYCEESGKIGIGAENSSFVEVPTMSEHRNILAFENYALKLVEE